MAAASQPFERQELTPEQRAKLDKIEKKIDKLEAELKIWSDQVANLPIGSEERKAAEKERAFFREERDKAQLQLKYLKVEFGQLPPSVLAAPEPKRLRLSNNVSFGEERFLAALPKSRLDDKRLVFEEELYETHDMIVYIRPCYEKLYSLIQPKLLTAGPKYVVTGTPGIGKSMFGYYALRRLLDAGISVIYIYQGWNSCHLYLPKKPTQVVLDTLARFDIQVPTTDKEGWLGRFISSVGSSSLIEDSNSLFGSLTFLSGEVVVILDPPRQWGAETFRNPVCGMLVVTSPTPQRTTAIDSQANAVILYMPLWTSSEIKDLLMARKNGKKLTKQEMTQLEMRLLRFGPIPRYVAHARLSHSEMMSIGDQRLVQIIKGLSSQDMRQIVNPVSTSPQISGRIIYIEADQNFQYSHKTFATEMVERQILVHFHRIERQLWKSFAESVRDVAGFASMVGTRSEIWWHSAMEAGGEFSIEQLFNRTRGPKKGRPRNVTFPKSAPRYSAKQKLTDILDLWDVVPDPETRGLYFHFLKGNVPAIDSIWMIDGAIGQAIFDPGATEEPPPVYACATQMTLSAKHSLNEEGVDTFMHLVSRCAPRGAKTELIFITDASLEKELRYVKVERYPHWRQWLIKVSSDRIFA